MISRKFVAERVMNTRVDLTHEQVDRLIDDAVRLLGNLIHYRHNGKHEDDDVVTAVLMIGQDIQEKVRA